MSFQRKIHWRPAFDKRDSDPKKNYGVHGVEVSFQLLGEGDGITFTIFTNWHLPHVTEEQDRRLDSSFPHLSCHPLPAGVDGHWKKPVYEGQTVIKDCTVTGGDCYSDGSSLLSQDIFDALVKDGDEAVWKCLEELYKEWKPK